MPSRTLATPTSQVTATLAAHRIGVWPLVFMVMAAAAPLTVIAGGATTGWAVSGVVGIPIAYLTIGVLLAVFSVGYVEMTRRMVHAGAFYTYITHGLGRIPGVAAAFVAVVGYNAMQIGLYGGFGGVFAGWLDTRFGVSAPWWVYAFAAWTIVTVLGVRRIDLSSRILTFLVVAEIVVAVVFGVVAAGHPAGAVSFDALSPRHLLAPGAGAALVIAVTGFVGFEGTGVFGEESKDPHRTVPRATYRAVALIGLLYAGCALLITIAVGPDRIVAAATAQSTELLFNLVLPHLGQHAVDAGHILFVTSLFAALLSFHHTAARYHFSLGREGVLPRAFGRTSLRSKAPKVGSLVQSGIAAAVLTVYAIAGWDPIVQLFFWVTVLGGLGVLILMAATSIAVAGYFLRTSNRSQATAWSGLIAPGIAAVGLSWVLVMTLAQFSTLLGVDATSALRWQLPALYAVAASIGVIWACYLRARNQAVYSRIGLGAHSAVTTTGTPGAGGAGAGIQARGTEPGA